MSTPKFKIGDRVKWKDSEGRARSGVITEPLSGSLAHCVKEAQESRPGWWHESHLSLDVPETPKFKIGDRVKWAHFGKPSFGFVRARLSEGWWKVEYTAGCMENCHESHLSLAVPEPKQFATKLEVELGAEIVRLNYQIIDQGKANALIVSMMTAEIGNGHRERFAKEAAQRELADAKDMINRLKTFIGLP